MGWQHYLRVGQEVSKEIGDKGARHRALGAGAVGTRWERAGVCGFIPAADVSQPRPGSALHRFWEHKDQLFGAAHVGHWSLVSPATW